MRILPFEQVLGQFAVDGKSGRASMSLPGFTTRNTVV